MLLLPAGRWPARPWDRTLCPPVAQLNRIPNHVSSAKTFEISVEEGIEAADIMDRVRETARGAGIVISGDDSTGQFKGTAEGTYRVDVDSRIIRVDVTSKPAFVPWSMVESALRKVFR